MILRQRKAQQIQHMPPPEFHVFTAPDRAFAAFEEAVLAANHSVIGGFRIFDMRTKLVSEVGRAVGDTWFDLLAHVVSNGVSFHLILSDFDPVYATGLHRATWRTVRQAAALREVTGAAADQVVVRAALHPATPGLVPRMAFLPHALERLRKTLKTNKPKHRAELPRLKAGVPNLHTVSHHQKLAVIDDDTLYIGGLDLNNRRFDTARHARPAEETWSDVQILLRNDPAVAEAKTHLETFEAVVQRQIPPPPMTHIQRTLSVDRRIKLPFLSPKTLVTEIEAAHLKAIAGARHLIYIETQFMRSPVIAQALAKAAQSNPNLHLIMVLPALPEQVAFSSDETGIDLRYGLELERDALATIKAAFGDRAVIACPVQPVMAGRDTRATRAGSPIIYVHNKVLVQDTAFALVGSGNLNGRSLRWDTEAALAITDPARLRVLRAALHRHWWQTDLDDAWSAPAQMQPLWRAEIERNTVRCPESRKGVLVTHDTTVHDQVGLPLPLVTDNMV